MSPKAAGSHVRACRIETEERLTAVRERRTEDRYPVPSSPTENGRVVVDLVSQTLDDLAGRPFDSISVLFVGHPIEYRHDPVFELAVVVVWYQEVPYPVKAPFTKASAVDIEASLRSEVRRTEAFDEVFFDASGRRDDARHVAMLYEEAEDVS